MNTLLPSLIRTYVPLLVSVVAGWLLSLGIPVTSDQKALLISGLSAAIAAGYYAAARVLEARYPWATRLLGSSVQPVAYAPAATATDPATPYGQHAAPQDPAPVTPTGWIAPRTDGYTPTDRGVTPSPPPPGPGAQSPGAAP